MEPHAERLTALLLSQDITTLAISAEIADLAGALEWHHRDPFDRLIAATSISLKIPLLSADEAFDDLSGRRDWPGRIW
jgi:PIN domain nuclease of toxin-antitoxin system